MRILLRGELEPTQREEIAQIAPGAEVITGADLERDPGLVEAVEVIYGGLPRELWARAGKVRWLQTSGAGVNGLIIPGIREQGITITNAPIHEDSITEHMFGMLLVQIRQLGAAWDQQREGRWEPRPLREKLQELRGRTLGILGVGGIGTQSARVGAAFGMRVVGMRRSGAPSEFVERMYTPDGRLPFFRECDVVMNLLPLTDATRGFVGREELAALKPGAIVINAGRGGTIDQEALLEALRSGQVGAALLDVTDPEPLRPDHPLWTAPNVFITPHIGGNQPGYVRRAGQVFLDNLRRYVAGQPLANVVDMDAGY